MDIKSLISGLTEAMRGQRQEYHLTLGKLQTVLHGTDQSLSVEFDFNGEHPNCADSYRGYYEDLSFDWSSEPRSVEQFSMMVDDCFGQTFTGYKGGEFQMDADTPLWAARYGNTGRAIVGVLVKPDRVVLETREMD